MKKVFFILIFVFLIAAGFFAFPRLMARRLTTTVTVNEGSVVLYKLDASGGRHFVREVAEGETASVVTLRASSFGLTRIVNAVFPGAINAVARHAREWAVKLPDDSLARFVPEKEVQQFVREALERQTPFKDAAVTLDADGFDGTASGKFGPLRLRVSANGIVRVEKNTNRLYLELHQLELGAIRIPHFIVIELEDLFKRVFGAPDFPLEFRELEYMDGGVLIYAVRKSGGNS